MTNTNGHVSNVDISASKEEMGWSSLGAAVYVKILIIGILFWYFFNEEIGKIVYRWGDDSNWSHGYLIPFFSLYLLNQHKKKLLSSKFTRNYLGLICIILCLFVFYPLNYVHFQIGYALPLIMIAALGSIVLFFGGWKLIKYSWLPVAYLVFAVPLPERLYKSFTGPMRIWAAQIATALLNLVKDLEATVSGVVIDVIYKGAKLDPPLNVAEACSGMRLLMAFLALGVAMAYLHYRPIWQRVILLASTIPIAILCNVVRVTITGFIYILWDPKYAQGGYHDMLGFLMLFLAFAIYGGLAWFMCNIIEEEPATEDVVARRTT